MGVHYHFGSKGFLYQSILDRFMQQRMASAERMLSAQPEDLAELRLRLILFCEETMISLLDDPDILRIALDEMLGGFAHGGERVAEAVRDHEQRLTDSLVSAQSRGLLREESTLPSSPARCWSGFSTRSDTSKSTWSYGTPRLRTRNIGATGSNKWLISASTEQPSKTTRADVCWRQSQANRGAGSALRSRNHRQPSNR